MLIPNDPNAAAAAAQRSVAMNTALYNEQQSYIVRTGVSLRHTAETFIPTVISSLILIWMMYVIISFSSYAMFSAQRLSAGETWLLIFFLLALAILSGVGVYKNRKNN